MTNRLETNRRQFVITTAAIGGGLAIGIGIEPASAQFKMNPRPDQAPPQAARGPELTAWMTIAPDDTIIVRASKSEMGNDAVTYMPMIICEELECDWSKIRVEFADPNRNAVEKVYESMRTVGSQGVRTSREFLQKAGARAREMLKTAAAAEWNVPVTEIDAKKSVLTHRPTGRTLRFGEMAQKASAVKLATEPTIKTPDQYTFLGKEPVPRLDTPLKVNGSAVYGIDITVPNMVNAAIRHSPVHGGKLKSFDLAAIKDRPGVITAVPVRGTGIRDAVAVVADTYWNAKTALDVMPIEWDDGAGGNSDTKSIFDAALKLLDQPGNVAVKNGDVEATMKDATKVLDATYQIPYLDHATMEPLSAVAHVTADKIDVWVGTQDADAATTGAAETGGMKPAQVFVHNLFLGGGFGRRSNPETTREAVVVSKAVGRPAKVTWSREETTRQGQYRPMAVTRFRAGLGANGMPLAWLSRTVSDSRTAKLTPAAFEQAKQIDNSALGSMSGMVNYYSVPNLQVEYKASQTHLELGFWRAPSGAQSTYFVESFVDELAVAAGKDPGEYRRALLANAKDPGYLKVLNDMMDKSGWGKQTFPAGTAQGMAICESAGTIVGMVIQVTMSKEGGVKLDKVHVAFDSGNIINKNDIEAQMEGQVVMAHTALMYGEINIRKGRVVEGNFDDYQMMRIDEMPQVITSYGGLTGGTKWGGIGEASLPVVFPAITNAIFKITGKRIRELPLKNHDLSWS